MTVFAKATLLAAALTAGLSARAAAQQECDINEGRPRDLANALVYLTNASNNENPEVRTRHLRNAVKAVSDNAERIDRDNTAGRNFIYGKALVLWMQQPGIGYEATRGQLGFSTDPDAKVDLVASLDSAFDRVLAVMPACEAELENWRMQQPWVDLVNGAIQMINASNLDSAEVLVNKSMVLTSKNPFGPNLLAAIAQERKDFAKAVELRRRTIELAAGDTAYNEMRLESIYNLAALLGAQAENAPEGPERNALARQSAEAFQRYVTEAPDSPQVVAARAGYANMLMLAGDTSAVSSMYAEQIANPHNYSDLQLVDAGVVAARAEKAEDAAKLFAAALQVNANNRDALFNLAASYYALKRYDDMFPLVRRLLSLDPSNPENVRLLALAFQGKQQTLTNSAQKRAATDSLIHYIQQVDSMPTFVSVRQFQRGAENVSLAGEITNNAAQARTFRIRVEFLDKDGNVVGEQEATVGPVAANEARPFRVLLERPGILAWRYSVEG